MRLDGSIPQKKRQGLIYQFQKRTGLQILYHNECRSHGPQSSGSQHGDQCGSSLEPSCPRTEEISRVHRMGQKRPVQAFLLVTEETLEEKLLGTLSAKHELALAALDPESK